MELKHATDLEIAKHLASHAATPTGKSREQNRVGKLLADRNARMKKAHVVQPMGLVYKEDRDENMKQEIADRLANTPAERAERKHRVQVAINRAKQLREGNKMKTFSKLQEAITPASPALVSAMNSLLADNFAFYLKAHNYHWNIEGADFAQYHEFLGNLYEDAHGAVDNIAERIRTLKAYALGTMENFMSETSITEDSSVPGPMQMLQNITMDNETLIESLTRAYKAAEADGRVGLANFLQDRIDAHEKHGWMLRSLVKGNLSESVDLSEVNSRHSFVAAQDRLTPRAKNVKQALSTKRRDVAATNKYGKVIGKIAGMKPKEVVANLKDMGEEVELDEDALKAREQWMKAKGVSTGNPKADRARKVKRLMKSFPMKKEEVEQIQEVGPQKKLKRVFNKLRDARAGQRYKDSGMPVPEREPGHKNTVDHNKAIGRALRKMGEETEQVAESVKVGPKNYHKSTDTVWHAVQHNGKEIGTIGTNSAQNVEKHGKWGFEDSRGYGRRHGEPEMNSKEEALDALVNRHKEYTKQVNEVLKPSMGASAYIHDFVHSKNAKFAGKSKAERTKMALGAYYSAKKGK